MLTMISNPEGQHHALNREGTAAVCRKNITPYTWTTRFGTQRATYEVHGEALRRSTHAHRVTCLGCQRRLAKITAEAFDAATAEDPSHTDTTVTPAELVADTADYLDSDTVRISQRVYLYDGSTDQQVAGNVVAIIGQALDTIVVQAWVWADERAQQVTFYRQRVRSGDQLRATVEALPVRSPFPIGSMVAAHLDTDRVYEVVRAELGTYDGRTRIYLEHADGERLAFQPSVLEKMFAPALEPFPNADHLIGRKVTLTSADRRLPTGTLSGVVARVRPAPAGARETVAELASGWLVKLTAVFVEGTRT